MENRNGLVVDVTITHATERAERETALEMLDRVTVGADRNYDTETFVRERREMRVTPHVALRKYPAIEGRTTRYLHYHWSQRVRRRVEEMFGWIKTVGGGRKLRYRGVARNQLWTEPTAVTYNLARMARLALALA